MKTFLVKNSLRSPDRTKRNPSRIYRRPRSASSNFISAHKFHFTISLDHSTTADVFYFSLSTIQQSQRKLFRILCSDWQSIKKPFDNLVESFPRDGARLDKCDLLWHLLLQLIELQHQQRLVTHLSIRIVHLRQHEANLGLLKLRLSQNRVQQDAFKIKFI